MQRRRIWLVYIALGVITGGSLRAIVTGREAWPFSPYPMYSEVQREHTLTRFELFGVTEEETSCEVPLLEYRYIQPFDRSRLRRVLNSMSRQTDAEPLLARGLRDCLVRYEALRRAGRHNGKRLQGMRLYRLSWDLDPWACNADHPDRRELMGEFMHTATGDS